MQIKKDTLQGIFENGSTFLPFIILVLTLLSDQTVFSRKIDDLSNGIETVRSFTNTLTNTMYALKQASEPLALSNTRVVEK